MTTYIGQSTVQYKCDWHEGCSKVTREYAKGSEGLSVIDQKARIEEKWFISMSDDRTYCPEHSPYNQQG